MKSAAPIKAPVTPATPVETPAVDANGSRNGEHAGYPGSKAASGLAERIIRQMPPHVEYIEGFAGHAAVYWRKRRAARSVLIDADPKVCDWLGAHTAGDAGVQVVNASFMDWITSYRWQLKPSTLIYLDPPYLRDVRSRLLYEVELVTKKEHKALLELCRKLPCPVLVSHYYHLLYHNELFDWRRVEIPAMTRKGKRLEVLWCNFPEADLLHDPRFAGADYRERENISRKRRRWAAKYLKMERRERQAVATALIECDRATFEMALRYSPANSAMQDLAQTPKEKPCP